MALAMAMAVPRALFPATRISLASYFSGPRSLSFASFGKRRSFIRAAGGATAVNYLPPYAHQGALMKRFATQTDASTDQLQVDRSVGVELSNYYSTNVVDSVERKKMEEFEEELSKIVGLHSMKQQLRTWAKGMLLDGKRRATGQNLGLRKAPHMVFLGNPGTGKTTVARMLGKLMHSIGVLSTSQVTEVQRSDLVGKYVGQTALKTKKEITKAKGGILFVDEAYRLSSPDDSNDFGVEALEEILSVLEEGTLVVIFAGYTARMKELLSKNEGFCRRVNHFFDFEDYSCGDLAEMLMLKMSKQNSKSRLHGFKLHPSCTADAVQALIARGSTMKLRSKMNGGLVDNMLNSARESLDLRLTFDTSGDELLTITLGDLENGLKQIAQQVEAV